MKDNNVVRLEWRCMLPGHPPHQGVVCPACYRTMQQLLREVQRENLQLRGIEPRATEART